MSICIYICTKFVYFLKGLINACNKFKTDNLMLLKLLNSKNHLLNSVPDNNTALMKTWCKIVQCNGITNHSLIYCFKLFLLKLNSNVRFHIFSIKLNGKLNESNKYLSKVQFPNFRFHQRSIACISGFLELLPIFRCSFGTQIALASSN